MGLYLTSAREESEKDGTLEYRPINGYVEFLKSIAKTWREQAMTRHISTDDWYRTCDIETTIKATDFNISDEAKAAGYKAGYERTERFINDNS